MPSRLLLGALVVSACTVDLELDPDPADDPGPAWCDGTTQHLYAPFASTDVDLFPDGLLVRDDPTSPTGERLEFTPETAPWLADAPAMVQGVAEAMNTMSGFGGLGGAVLRFDAPVAGMPSTAEESLTSDAWIWADLSTSPPTRIPYDVQILDEGTTVVLWPMVPLQTATRHAIVVTTAAQDEAGDCIVPAAGTRSLLHGDQDEGEHTARFDRVRPEYRDAATALGLTPADVSAISVYGTHDDLGPMLRAADVVVRAPVTWGAWQGCEEREEMWQCDTSTTVLDMRNDSGLVDDTVTPVEAEIPVMVWLPRDAEGPVPLLVFGHGLQSRRHDGWEVAKRVQSINMGVIAMPAVQHGEHPSADPDDTTNDVLKFLAVDIPTVTVDALAIRGHFNQTNLDRLRLLELLRTQPDLDGDGTDDIDPDRIAYIGASLGAALGPGLIALDEELDAAVLTIGGGRLASLVRDQEALLSEYAPFVDVVLGEGVLTRLLPIAQHAIDPADPGTWAPHVLQDCLDGRAPPSLLFAVGLEDEVFSVDAGNTLARALGIPQIGPVVTPVPLLVAGGEAPVVDNAFDGTRTSGFFQYDRITRDDDPAPRRPTHGDSARSNESGAQIRAFFGSWADDGRAEIIDPFEALGTPERPEDW